MIKVEISLSDMMLTKIQIIIKEGDHKLKLCLRYKFNETKFSGLLTFLIGNVSPIQKTQYENLIYFSITGKISEPNYQLY